MRSPEQGVLAKQLAVLGVLAALFAAAVLTPAGGAIRQNSLELVDWIRSAGAVGPVVFAGIYVVATVLVLPCSALGLRAGFVYGPVWGTLLVSPVSVTGACLAFFLARKLGRKPFERRWLSDPRFVALDSAVGQDGFRLVLLLRLSPFLPFGLLNYALGLTRVRAWSYVWASWLGMFPATVLYVYLGSLVTQLSGLTQVNVSEEGGWGKNVYWLGLGATVLLGGYLARRSLAWSRTGV